MQKLRKNLPSSFSKSIQRVLINWCKPSKNRCKMMKLRTIEPLAIKLQ